MKSIPEPLNISERYQYETVIRLDALCNMLSSIIEGIAEREGIPTESNEIEDVEPEVEPEEEPVEEEIVEDEPVEEEVVEEDENEYINQCIGITSKNKQCKREAQEGSSYCSTHEPEEE